MTTSQTVTYAANYGAGGYGLNAYPDPQGQDTENHIANRSLTPLPPPVFTGLKLKEDVILGDLVLNTIDENGVLWVCTDIDGWWVHPDPDIPDVTRGWRDGSYDARGKWLARQITLNGSILTKDPDLLPAARATLIESTNLVYTGAWLKTKENPTRASYVRLSGRPSISTVNARGRTDFSIGLRAADPVKYSWNDSDPDGYDVVYLPCKNPSNLETGVTTITNAGNTPVSVFLEIRGPIVGDGTIVNSTNGEVLTIVNSLRAGIRRTVSAKELTANVATLTFTANHTFIAGDNIIVSGVDSTFNGEYEVTNVPSSNQISYVKVATNVTSTASSGFVDRGDDILEVDTYEREVALNGSTLGARVYIDTLTDWLRLEPGSNTITFIDEGQANSDASLYIYYRSGWIG